MFSIIYMIRIRYFGPLGRNKIRINFGPHPEHTDEFCFILSRMVCKELAERGGDSVAAEEKLARRVAVQRRVGAAAGK